MSHVTVALHFGVDRLLVSGALAGDRQELDFAGHACAIVLPGEESDFDVDQSALGLQPLSRVVPATSWLLSLLALKLTRTRRVSHVDDLLLSDPAAALFAALATLPKKSALTDYSYRTSHENQRAFLAALDTAMIAGGLATREEAIFDLDFHAVMAWGSDPALEKHYVPTRSQRSRSVLTFFAQDSGTHNLLLRQRRPVQGHRRTARSSPSATTGRPPAAPTRTCWSPTRRSPPNPCSPNPGARGVTFLTLRMRSPALLRHINSLRPADYKTITLDRSGRYHRPRVHESTARLSTTPPPCVN